MRGKKYLSFVLALLIAFAIPSPVMADQTTDQSKPYISLGADLNATERSEVLNLLGVSESDLKNYTVIEVTNQEEHQYLDSYMDNSIIGSFVFCKS